MVSCMFESFERNQPTSDQNTKALPMQRESIEQTEK